MIVANYEYQIRSQNQSSSITKSDHKINPN